MWGVEEINTSGAINPMCSKTLERESWWYLGSRHRSRSRSWEAAGRNRSKSRRCWGAGGRTVRKSPEHVPVHPGHPEAGEGEQSSYQTTPGGGQVSNLAEGHGHIVIRKTDELKQEKEK